MPSAILPMQQVSRLWRAMTLNLTQLWARIHVEWNTKQRTLWLERSGTRPLDIYITIDCHRPERWVPIQSPNVFGDQDLFLHSSRWRSLSLRSSGRLIAEEFLDRLMRSMDLKSLESLTLLSPTHGPYNMTANFGGRPESASALRRLILRDIEAKALHLAVDNVVTLRLSGIPEENDPRFWARIFGSSDRLECLILSRLYYPRSEATGGGPAIPVRTHLRTLVLGNGNGRRFFRYMIRELKAPALLSLDLYLPNCSERYAREITPMVMAFFRSSPLIEDLTIRMNHSITIKILNALRLPHTKEALVSSENIYLPHLRHLAFHQLLDNRHDALFDEFHDELLDFLIFRSKVHWYDVQSGRWQLRDDSKALECLELDSLLYEVGTFEDFVQDLFCVPDEVPAPYRFHEPNERWSDPDETETTWEEPGYLSADDGGLDAGFEEKEEYMAVFEELL
ncbi:hypothetical protein BS47DRAFT_609425 [Hydnum rufescens UP504]|uniref:F-box domain-containing protein n=1 Tax=Hydnum rufescens UP504 TaxID=1448309 RepID=A0A9P6B377_9AGAM|nr:hypothetical protein BS47DRAFT_609425 [Hydnum rufescens UP504]